MIKKLIIPMLLLWCSGAACAAKVTAYCIDNSHHDHAECTFNYGSDDNDIMEIRYYCQHDSKSHVSRKHPAIGGTSVSFGGPDDPDGPGCSNHWHTGVSIEITQRDGRVVRSGDMQNFTNRFTISPTQRHIKEPGGIWKQCWHRQGTKKCYKEVKQ